MSFWFNSKLVCEAKSVRAFQSIIRALDHFEFSNFVISNISIVWKSSHFKHLALKTFSSAVIHDVMSKWTYSSEDILWQNTQKILRGELEFYFACQTHFVGKLSIFKSSIFNQSCNYYQRPICLDFIISIYSCEFSSAISLIQDLFMRILSLDITSLLWCQEKIGILRINLTFFCSQKAT